MRPLTLRVPSGICRIRFVEPPLRLEAHCPRTRSLLITDRRVYGLHRRFFADRNVVFVGRGEARKTLSMVKSLFGRFLRASVDRETTLVAVGGGIVGDVAGLAAARYLRGLKLVLVPTTLLAQVDASVGGKNGVNLDRFKNLIGTIRQPDLVLIDPGFLNTLPPREIRNGLAEVVKSAAIGDAGMFRYLERNSGRALALDPVVIPSLIGRSLRIKIRIVESDERESGPRRLLNFGHTLGHALERTGPIDHGAAVSIGMCAAARISARLGFIPEAEADRLVRLLRSLGLPTSAAGAARRALEFLDRDKKRSGEAIRFILPRGEMGQAVVLPIPMDALKEHLRAVC